MLVVKHAACCCVVTLSNVTLCRVFQALFQLFIAMPYNCAVYNCVNNSKRDKDRFSFYRFPAIVKHQGEQTRLLSAERRQSWINNVARDDDNLTEEKIEHTRVCSNHFISGKNHRLHKLIKILTT